MHIIIYRRNKRQTDLDYKVDIVRSCIRFEINFHGTLRKKPKCPSSDRVEQNHLPLNNPPTVLQNSIEQVCRTRRFLLGIVYLPVLLVEINCSSLHSLQCIEEIF